MGRKKAKKADRRVRNAEVVSSILIASTKDYGHLEEVLGALFLSCIQSMHTFLLAWALPSRGESSVFPLWRLFGCGNDDVWRGRFFDDGELGNCIQGVFLLAVQNMLRVLVDHDRGIVTHDLADRFDIRTFGQGLGCEGHVLQFPDSQGRGHPYRISRRIPGRREPCRLSPFLRPPWRSARTPEFFWPSASTLTRPRGSLV